MKAITAAAAALFALVACSPPKAPAGRVSAAHVITMGGGTGVSGGGTTGTLAEWSSATAVGNSSFTENAGTTTATTSYDLVINGTFNNASLQLPALDTQRIGIGTSSPQTQVHIVSNVEARYEGDTYTNTAQSSSEVTMQRGRGTVSAPLTVTQGDQLGRIVSYGYDGTQFVAGADIAFRTDATVGANQMPTGIYFETGGRSAPTVIVAHMKVGSAGHISSLGTAPTASSCGTSPVIDSGSTDNGGGVTTGTGATGCTITWASSYSPVQPTCSFSCRSGHTFTYSITANAVTITFGTAVAGDVFDWVCWGHSS